ncbi:hypothetical protein Tco_0262548 [Tanacetum coccineum]
MDDPNITMEDYIRLKEDKTRRRGKVYNWETATYGKIWDNEDVYDLGSVETEFPAIAFNDTLTSEATLSRCAHYVSYLERQYKLTLEYRLTNPTMKITRTYLDKGFPGALDKQVPSKYLKYQIPNVRSSHRPDVRKTNTL